MTFELKNFKSVKVENNELIFEWDTSDGSAVSKMAFPIGNIATLGIEPKPKTKEDNDDCQNKEGLHRKVGRRKKPVKADNESQG